MKNITKYPLAWAGLMVIAILMIWIFVGAFTNPYSLTQYGTQPWQSIATLSHFSLNGALIYIGAFAVLFGLYIVGISCVRKLKIKFLNLSGILGIALIFNVALLPMYPVDAADVYDYIIRGRLSTVYHLNPLKDTPAQVSTDPFYSFVGWREVPSAYGPAWEIVAAVTSAIAGDNNTVNVIAFKVLSILGALLTTILLWLTLRIIAPERALIGAYLFSWNPIVVFMVGGTAHNDTLLAACVLLSIYCLVRRWYVGATLSAVFGGLVKFIPFLLLPMIVLILLRDVRSKRKVRELLTSTLFGTLLIVIVYAPFWNGTLMPDAERRARMFTGSVATVARELLIPAIDHKPPDSPGIDTPLTNRLINGSTLCAFGLFYLVQLWGLCRSTDSTQPLRAITAVLIVYLLVACIWFQAWYVIWIVAPAALLENTSLRRIVLLLSYLVTWQPLFYYYVTLRPDGWMPVPWRDVIPIAVTMGITWVYCGVELIAASRKRATL